MDWMTGIQNAIDYMEERLDEKMDYEKIARHAACSAFYFQRIFNILCGISLGEYIRNRRLTLAGSELAATDAKVIDVAFKYGYESPESFSRAFFRFHGVMPSEAKKRCCELKSFSRVSVQMILKGGSTMEYRIEKKRAWTVMEKTQVQQVDDGEKKNTIPALWVRCCTDGTVKTLLQQAPEGAALYGICYNNAAADTKMFEYGVAAPYGGGEIPEGFSVREIPERTWAIFPCQGPLPDAIKQTWHRIYSEFFPTSFYRPTCEMDIEVYPNGVGNASAFEGEIWVAVEKK